ncbi:hypothetical protein KXX12_008101, partial [Aspergillus fumigatus]
VIRSVCRSCGQTLSICTRDNGQTLDFAKPAGIVIWSGQLYADDCAATSLCTQQGFFCTSEHMERWRADKSRQDDEGVPLNLSEALEPTNHHLRPCDRRGLTPAHSGRRGRGDAVARHDAPQARLRRAAPLHFAPPGAARRFSGPLRSFSPPTPASGEPWGFGWGWRLPMILIPQPPFFAGLSGYRAELGASFIGAIVGFKVEEREDHAA